LDHLRLEMRPGLGLDLGLAGGSDLGSIFGGLVGVVGLAGGSDLGSIFGVWLEGWVWPGSGWRGISRVLLEDGLDLGWIKRYRY